MTGKPRRRTPQKAVEAAMRVIDAKAQEQRKLVQRSVARNVDPGVHEANLRTLVTLWGDLRKVRDLLAMLRERMP